MSKDRLENWCIAIFGAGVSSVLTIVGIGGALVIGLAMYDYERSRPAISDVVPNDESQSFDVELTNPVPQAKRILEVKFVVDHFRPPEKLIGAIETRRVVFVANEYDPNSRTFVKILHDAEMPADGNLNMQFFISSPSRHEQWAIGQLKIFVGSRANPEIIEYANFPILCTKSENDR